jgi:cation diffusion facilitator family transporter
VHGKPFAVAEGDNKGAARRTVLIALGANAAIAVAKFVGGIAAGSSAMLSEAAHSVADTTNQVFLLMSLGFAERDPDPEHPFGYGKERFFWAFMAAVVIFVSGAGFSAYEGLSRILESGSEKGAYGIAYAVLGFAFVAEGTSWVRAYRQTRGEARQAKQSPGAFVKRSRDPTTKTVLFEDTAAVIGVVLAIAGVALHQITGDKVWDGAASLAIAVLLVVVAVGLGHNTYELLIGAAALPEERRRIEEVLERRPEVDRVLELMTMALAPNRLLVAVRYDAAADMGSDDLERASNEIDDELRRRVPTVWQVFLDPTPRPDGAGG